MSLSQLVQQDAKAILGLDGDSAVLAAPAALELAPFPLACLHFSRGMSVNADGMAVVGAAASASFSLDELSDNSVTDPEVLKIPGWVATIGGRAYRFADVMIDETAGLVTIILKRNAAA